MNKILVILPDAIESEDILLRQLDQLLVQAFRNRAPILHRYLGSDIVDDFPKLIFRHELFFSPVFLFHDVGKRLAINRAALFLQPGKDEFLLVLIQGHTQVEISVQGRIVVVLNVQIKRGCISEAPFSSQIYIVIAGILADIQTERFVCIKRDGDIGDDVIFINFQFITFVELECQKFCFIENWQFFLGCQLLDFIDVFILCHGFNLPR